VIPTDRLDYVLPPEQIAQTPADRRDGSRLLVVDRASRSVEHHSFDELPTFMRPGDILFRNNASVLPARLHGQRSTGGKVECLLLRKLGDGPGGAETWECLVRPGRRLQPGALFEAADGALKATVLALAGDGPVMVAFTSTRGESVVEAANRTGDVPLPPYIERKDASRRAQDLERYETVYANRDRQVAVAAPTAGLHFTQDLLGRLESGGVRMADVTLHVGLGTFRPIATETVEAHPIHSETYEIPVATQRLLFPPHSGRRVAVGTTTVRSVEDFMAAHAAPLAVPHVAEAGIFIYPPRQFLGIDVLITNFHQPRSTLLCLVAAFLTPGSEDGIDWLMEIYAGAVSRGYRFFSYGDSMLIL
jgi:S-adenosylmethionine:tRNA ribosyltransferase-isomerase